MSISHGKAVPGADREGQDSIGQGLAEAGQGVVAGAVGGKDFLDMKPVERFNGFLDAGFAGLLQMQAAHDSEDSVGFYHTG
jgi:hypothetical protein